VAALATAVVAAVQGGPAGARLGVIETPGSASQWWSGPYAMIGLYATLAFAVAMVAARLGAPRRQVALSGLVGPALLASAYAIAGTGGSVDPGSVAVAGSAATGSLGTIAPTGSGADVRIAVLVAAVAGLLASTGVAMRRTRSVVPAPVGPVGAAVWPAEGSGAVVATRAAAVAEPVTEVPPKAKATRRGRADAAPKTTRKAAADPAVPAQRKPARKAADAKPAAPAGKTAPRKSTPRKAARDAAPQPRPEPVAETREERRIETTSERLSRREREHVKWMENLLNTPPDPTLTTRRSSS
jgi:hypothetical protein